MPSNAATIAETLSAFAYRQFCRPDVPLEQAGTAMHRLLDNIGCMYFGLSVPPARRMVDLAVRLGQGVCPVVGLAETTSAPAAALAQGILAQAFELNDLGAYVHAGACVVPAALAALAESQIAVTGSSFLAAVSVGYEVTVRLAEAIGPGAELDIGWHTPGFHGAVGAAVTAALILGSDPPTIARTIGIASDLAGGGLMVARLGSDTKRMHCGRGAETGVLAALLAREGVQCRLDALEHSQWGYCRAMAGGKPAADLAALTRDLGHEWVGFDRTAIKYYCVGAEVLGVLDNINKLKKRDGFNVNAIEAITVGTPEFFVLAESHSFPESPTEVHFNIEYGVAMTLLFEVAPIHEAGAQLLRRWMAGYLDPQVRQLAAKVHHVVDDELEARNPYSVDSKVSIRFTDGRQIHEETQYVRGAKSKATMQFAPMDAEKIYRKFAVLTQDALSEQRKDKLRHTVMTLLQASDARDLLRAMRQ